MAVSEPLALPAIRSIQLDNGLRILVQEVHTAPLVSVWCWYRVGSGDEQPGHTGVSHWVEHMNFKGTTNIPRDEMKGIVERFGGTWNGYTWIDQTTYLETAGTSALDTLLFIEAERMAHGLYEPDECESERTVIISELQGGENDPEQLLDTEVAATAFRAHSYRHPTIGWIDDLALDEPRRSVRPLPAATTSRATRRSSWSATSIRTMCCGARKSISESSPGRRRAARSTEPAQIGERRVRIEREGTTAYLKFAWRAPAVTDPDFFPMLVLDAALTGAKGDESVVELSRRSAAAQSPPLHQPRRARPRIVVAADRWWRRVDPFLYSISLTAMQGVDAALRSRPPRSRPSSVCSTRGSPTRMSLAPNASFVRGWCSKPTASPTSPTSSGSSRRSLAPGFFHTIRPAVDAVTTEQVVDVARRRLKPDFRTVGWFQPMESRHDDQL